MAKITKIMLRDQTEKKKNSQNDHIEQNQLRNRQIAKKDKTNETEKMSRKTIPVKMTTSANTG